MNYIKFLEGAEKDDKGRYVTDIISYSNMKLELIHDYIQRVFPTDEQSKFSNIKPITAEEIEALRGNEAAKENIRKMYQRMLTFWKIDGVRYTEWGLKGPFRLWNNWNNHNHWRMTRLLKCFRLLDMEQEYKDFSNRLSKMIVLKKYGESVRITKKTAQIWKENMDASVVPDDYKPAYDKKHRGIGKWIVLGIVVLLILIAVIFRNQIAKLFSHRFEKPIIYLYPVNETEIHVELGNPERVTVSYPEYNDGWKVFANPSGELTDLETNRNLYALYYEAQDNNLADVEKDGFVIRSEDTIPFLEEKLAVLGLSDREAEEFIVYWLPRLKEHTYNYIRFATAEEIDSYMPLNISPKPDTIIRVCMLFKGLESPMEVEEQVLIPVEREGYTAVEWGGIEIK